MQAYSRAALAPVTAASPISTVASQGRGTDGAMANGSTGRPLDVVTAAQALASLLLEGLSDHDLAVFARRLLPHLHEGRPGRTRAHCAYTVASLAAELGVSDKAIRCAITRQELRAVKRGSRWIISAEAVDEWTTPDVHPARARRRPAPLPAAPKAAGGNDGLIWPQCDGLIWPHLPSERDRRVRAFPSTDRRSQKGWVPEWSCSRGSAGIGSSRGCRCARWRAGMGCIGGRSARRWSRRCRRSASVRRGGRRRRWGRIAS